MCSISVDKIPKWYPFRRWTVGTGRIAANAVISTQQSNFHGTTVAPAPILGRNTTPWGRFVVLFPSVQHFHPSKRHFDSTFCFYLGQSFIRGTEVATVEVPSQPVNYLFFHFCSLKLPICFSDDSNKQHKKQQQQETPVFNATIAPLNIIIVNNTNALFLHQDQQPCAKHQCQLIKQQRQKS